jgi:hypothetical protein
MSVDSELTRDTLPGALQDAFSKWKFPDAPGSPDASANLSRLLQYCREQVIPLTCVVLGSAITIDINKGGMYPRTARRNGQRQDGGDYAFDTGGQRRLSFHIAAAGCLVMKNRFRRRLGIFVPQEIVNLSITPSEQPSVAN